MAKLEGRPEISAKIVISLNEDEAAALDALAGYGVEAFLKHFYEKLGKAYLEPHEKGLRSLFEAIHNGPCNVHGILRRVDDAKEVFAGTKVARYTETVG